MEKIMEQLNTRASEAGIYFDAHPDQAYLACAGIFAFMLLGVILGWEWTYDPQGDSSAVSAHNRMGRRGYRVSMGIAYSIGLLAFLGLWYFTQS